MSTLDTQWTIDWLKKIAESISEHREELIDLDRAIGDGDHGENMDRGFKAVVAALDGSFESPTEVLQLTAKTLISTVGGASGPLYGTAFLRGAKAIDDFDAQGVAAFIQGALDGITARGKASEGEKTMIDAWAPAARAAQEAADAGQPPQEVFQAAAAAAREGASNTIDMVATKGRASYLGERSKGHQDPGATSTALILEAAG